MAYKPFKVKTNQDIYSKYGDKRMSEHLADDSHIKVFGFRSGLAYKMIPAILYYIFALLYIVSGIYGEIRYLKFEPVDIILEISKYIFWFIIFFSPIIFLSNFKYRDSLPFFKNRKIGSTIIGLVLVWMFCYFMANINIYCMSQTYKDSLSEHEAYIKKQQERALQKNKEKEITTQNESITIGTSKTMFYYTHKDIVCVEEV